MKITDAVYHKERLRTQLYHRQLQSSCKININEQSCFNCERGISNTLKKGCFHNNSWLLQRLIINMLTIRLRYNVMLMSKNLNIFRRHIIQPPLSQI